MSVDRGRLADRCPGGSPGWRALLYQADEDLRRVDPDYRVVDSKSKWGRCDITVEASRPELHDALWRIVAVVEQASERTCHICGEAGRQRRDELGGVETTCDAHAGTKRGS